MKNAPKAFKFKTWIFYYPLCISLVLLSACGSGGGGDDSSSGTGSSGTGSVSFGLALQDSGTMRAFNNPQQDDNNGPIDCQTHEIATIEAQVVDEKEELLAEGGPWDCEDGEGTISDVEAGDNRKAKISAKDSDGVTIFTGESEPFAVVAGELTDVGLITLLPVNVAPLPPTGVTATAGIGQIALNWLPVADATTYNVYFSTSTGVSKTNFEGVFRGVGQTSFIHSNLAGGDTFFYVVTAQNDIGESDESTEVSATVLSLPLPPTGVTATAGIGQISLNWLSVADATTYNVYLSTSPGVSKSNSEGVFSGVAQTSFIHANLLAGDTFFYVVTAQNDIGESDESAEVSATVPVNSRLIGDFIGTGFGSDPWTGLSNADFDGFGGGSYQDIATSDDFLEGGSLTYNLDSDGILTSTLSDGTVFDGILSPDNNIFAVVDTDFGGDEFIEMDVAIKKSTGLTNASLNGVYIGVRISSFGATALTTTTFRGNGTGSLDGAEFTYSVNPEDGGVNPDDGSVSISFPNNIDALRGIVSGDGNVVSLVDTSGNDNNDDISMSVLIKTDSGLSNATLSGDYIAVSFGFSDGVPETAQTSIFSDGSIDPNGNGNMDFVPLSSSSPPVGTPFSATYSVADNGRLTINSLPNGDTLEGIVHPNGDIFTFVTIDSNTPLIGVAIRKTQ